MRHLFCLFLSITWWANAFAEYPKPPLEAYGALPQITAAELSPDGTRVAAIVNRDGESSMQTFNLDGSPGKMISLDRVKARGVSFYDSSHVIIRVSSTKELIGFRSEFEFSGAFSINLSTGKTVQLLKSTPNLYPAQTGLGKVVGKGKNDGEVLMPAYVGLIFEDPPYDLLRTKLNSTVGRRAARGTHDTVDWFIGDAGRVLARERYNDKLNRYRIDALIDGNWTNFFEQFADTPPMAILGVFPDESGLVFIEESGTDQGFEAMMKIDFAGEVSGPVFPLDDREIETIYSDQNRKIVGIRYAGVKPEYAFLDQRLSESISKVKTLLPDATIKLDSWSDDRDVVLYHIFDAALGDVWLVERKDHEKLEFIAHRRPDIPVEALGQLINIQYPTRDGMTIQAVLTVPPNYARENADQFPAIVLPHRGPEHYDQFEFDWKAQFFANRGYVVFQPNFRGSVGFGRAFREAGNGEWGGKMQDDITDGVRALARSGMLDPDRICIVGASFGGYAALSGAANEPGLYQCAVAIAPVTDLPGLIKHEKVRLGDSHWVIKYWEEITTEGQTEPNFLNKISPIHFAERIETPVLLLHGTDDTSVPHSQSVRMKRAMERADKSVEMVTLRGEDHWLSVAETRVQTLQEIDRFISKHLPLDE